MFEEKTRRDIISQKALNDKSSKKDNYKPESQPDYIDQMFMDAQKDDISGIDKFFPFDKNHELTKRIKASGIDWPTQEDIAKMDDGRRELYLKGLENEQELSKK